LHSIELNQLDDEKEKKIAEEPIVSRKNLDHYQVVRYCNF